MCESGEPVHAYTIRNQEIALEVIEYGVRTRSLVVHHAPGGPRNVVLGLDSLRHYEQDTLSIGAMVGRYANRIRNGAFALQGENVSLSRNHGQHHLHGGIKGFAHRCWQSTVLSTGVRFMRRSPAGEEGYPGNLDCTIDVTLSDNCVTCEITAVSDADTVFNPTSHTYFDLSASGSIEHHSVSIEADSYVAVDQEQLPTGEMLPVAGTPLDLRQVQRLGQTVYDHCYVLNPRSPEAVSARASATGVMLSLVTTEPGLQLYTGDGLLRPRSGFCLEPQHYPDSPNFVQFPSTLLEAGATFRSVTEYRFEVISPS